MSTAKDTKDDAPVPEVPLALVSNAYLDEWIAQMREKPGPWENYHRASLITTEEFSLIQKFDRRTVTELNALLEEEADAYASLYLKLLQRPTRVDTVQYILVFVDQMLADHDERAAYFHRLTAEVPDLPYSPFLKCLGMDDDYVPLQASKILTILICSSPSPSAVDVTEFFKWITQQLGSQNPNVVDLAVQVLESLLRIRQYRRVFWDTPHAVDSLVNILKRSTPTLQMQYQVIFCLWLLAFESEIAAQLNRKYDIIPTLILTAKAAIKEKVIRVVIATFRNLVEKAPEANLAAMLVARLLPFCENLATRKWTDSEILEDVVYLRQELQDNFQSLTTFEEYASELQTGKLEWSPPHGSETFWKQNAARLNENDAELLRILSRLLVTSQDPVVLAVSAHDIGQYVKFGPKDAKKMVQEIGAKQRVMELMTHEDPDVRYQALLAVQKYMVNAWEL